MNIRVYKIRKIKAPADIPSVKSISVVDINANLKEITPQQVDLGTNLLISAETYTISVLTCSFSYSFYFYLKFSLLLPLSVYDKSVISRNVD